MGDLQCEISNLQSAICNLQSRIGPPRPPHVRVGQACSQKSDTWRRSSGIR